jgi:hypothetical protein
MQYRKAKIVSEPKAGSGKNVVAPMQPFVGSTEELVICGNCKTMLIKGYEDKFKNYVIKCMNCNKFNEV